MYLEGGGKGSSSLIAQNSLLGVVNKVRTGGGRMVDVISALIS